MNSRILVNLGLLVFLSISIIVFLNRNNDLEIKTLTSINTDTITEIRINRKPDGNIVFKKNQKDIWHMTKPHHLKAHQFRIKTLLGLAQAPVDISYDIDSLNLASYALDPPRASISFNQTDILFGKTSPVNNKRYLLAENKLVLLNDQTYPLISAQASSFIDLSLIPDNFNLNRIETPSTLIHRNNDGAWESSAKNNLNADQIQSFLQHWKSAQAFAVHKYMQRKHLGKIEVSAETKTIIFEITDDDPWLILALPEENIEYHLDKSLKNILFGILKQDSNDA